MNIDKEVEKYEKKKAKLLSGLVGRLTNYSDSKLKNVENIDIAMSASL